MKHKLQLIAVMALAFLAASCQRENLEPVAGGSTVTYTVQIPDAIATKAIGDGHSGVTELIYEVYREAQLADLNAAPIYEGEAEINDQGVAALELEFVKNQKFTVLFWAQNPDVDVYTTDDLRNVRLAQTLTANNVNTAVFAGSDKVDNCVSAANGAVDLVRPIAQLRIGTTPESLVIRSTTTVTLIKSDLKVKGLSTTYNVATKAAGADKSEFTYSEADVPAETFKANNVDYQYVAMSYVGFASDLGANIDVEFNINTSEGVISHEVVNVPVKPNYRTNIVGNLITASADYNVSINDNWETTEHNVKVVTVSDAQGLQAAIDNSETGTETNVKLEGDIDLESLFAASTLAVTKVGDAPLPIVIPAEKTLTLDLNGFTITTPWENETAGKHYYAFNNNGTLNIVDSKANGKIIARGINNSGKMTLESGTIEACDGNGGYGVINYAGAEFVMNGGTVATIYDDGDIPGVGYDATTLRVDEGATATINGGTINNICNFTVAIDNAGTVTINGGTFTSVHTTVANKASMTIEGGSFTCNGLEGITAHALWAAAGTTTINGGTFNGKDNYNGFNVDASAGAVVNITGGEFLPVHSGSLYGDGTISVTGGEFFDDPSKRVAEGYFAKQENGKYVVYKAVAAIGETMYKSIEDAIAAVETSATITVLCDAEMADKANIAAGQTVVIDLNGCTISAVDNTEKNYQIIQNNGNLTIKNSAENTAKMTVKATINSGWSRYSAVIANTVGGNLTVEGNVVLEHLGGTDMAYGIDNLTNGKGTYAVTTINGATVKSPYRAVRQFLNGIEATNELYVKAGSELRGDNKSIFFHDPSKNANTGKLVVESGAELYGDVYLFVTEGSTEWPVEVSIAASALADASEVLSGNVPSGYDVINDNGTWTVVEYPSFSELVEKVITGSGTYEGNGETYMIIPASGDARTTDDRTVPNRLQNYGNPDVYYAQYQRFADLTDINISNVTITFAPAAITVQDAWNTAGATTTSENINGEIQFMNTGKVTLTNCVFNTVSVSPFNATELTVTGCEFNDLKAYAIKDVKANTVINKNEFNNCNGGFWFNAAPATITAKENIFSVGRRGAIQFSASGDYTDTSIEISGNKVEGALLWQLNTTLSYDQYKAIIDNNTYTEAYVDGSVIPAEK